MSINQVELVGSDGVTSYDNLVSAHDSAHFGGE